MKLSKSGLAIELSKLKVFETPKVRLEQYPTDSEIAGEVLWLAYMRGDIEGKEIADLGCGTGILGLGTMILGAKCVHFIDVDSGALSITKTNYKKVRNDCNIEGKSEFINSNINEFKHNVDTVVQNPPFGTKDKHADKVFLEKAFSIAKVIYSIHKIESAKFIERISADNGFKLTDILEFDFPLKNTLEHHKKKIHRIKVGCWRLEKK